MALSGSFYTNVGSYWRLQLEWSATQSVSGNYSDVTARLYWIDRGSQTGIISSASKTASITIAGSSGSKSVTAGLNRNQKKLLHTRTVRVNHSSDGTGSFSLSAYFDAKVTLGGTYYNRISLSSRSFTLNTIPRASSITSSASWTAGNNRSVSISRASSSFTHTVRWQVQDTGGTWRTIKTATGVKTSVSSSFTTAQNRDIFNRLAQTSSRPSRIQIETYSGSTQIGGTVTKTGTVTAPSSSTLTSGTSRSMYIDDDITVGISRNNSSFTHDVVFTVGSYSKTISGITTSRTWNPTSSEEESLYAQLASTNSRSGTLKLTTYYDGVQVRSTRSYTFTFRVRNSNPTFTGDFTYRDTNATTTAITGNNQYIVQGKSTVTIEIPSTARATANNGASMDKYEVTVNGVTRTVNYSTSTVSVNVGTVNASSNISIVVKAIDSRGNSTSRSKTMQMLPYRSQTVNVNAERLNSFESSTTIKISGSFSQLLIGASRKNTISTIRYRYKRRSESTYGSWVTRTPTMSGSSYTGASATVTLNNMQAWDLQVQVTDKLGTITVNTVVPVGKPILFLDSEKNSLGVNRMPRQDYAMEVDGKIFFNNPNTAEGVLPHIGSIESNGREFLILRADEGGSAYSPAVNLYASADANFPNEIRYYFGGNPAVGAIMNENGVGLRGFHDGKYSNMLWIRSAPNMGHTGTNFIGTNTNHNNVAIVQATGYHRTLFFTTNTSARLSLEPTGSLLLPNASGSTVRLEFAQQHFISVNNNMLTLYTNRGGSGTSKRTFQIRSHNNKGSYRTDLYMDADGNMGLGWGVQSLGYKFTANGDGRFAGNLRVDDIVETRYVDHTGSNNYMYIRTPSAGLRVTALGTTSTYTHIRGSNVGGTSLEEYKEDITPFEGSALDIVSKADIYNYRLKEDMLNGIDKINTGFVIGAKYKTPNELMTYDREAIDLYSLGAINTKAIQEQNKLIEKLREELEITKNELNAIKKMVIMY